MPINDLQIAAREIGRIRLGEKGNKGQPVKRDTFRLTSQNRAALDAAARLYGGTVRPWPGHEGHFEICLVSKELPFMASAMDISQWYEQWNAGGCIRRCTGSHDSISDGPCTCNPEARECKMTTRFSVYLYELPDLGVFRMESHGYYAATELPFMAGPLIAQAKQGKFIKATLAIEARTVKKPGQPTRNFIVPVIRMQQSMGSIMAGAPDVPAAAPALPEPPRAIPAVFEERPTFRQHMLNTTKAAWEEMSLEPTPASIIQGAALPREEAEAAFKGGSLAWTRLNNASLFRMLWYAKNGAKMLVADDQTVKDTLEGMKAEYEREPPQDLEDIEDDECDQSAEPVEGDPFDEEELNTGG